VRTELLDYDLPDAAIARFPTDARDGARLLVLDSDGHGGHDARLRDSRIVDFPELVPEGALVVLNATRVRRARVFGARRPGGGRVEFLFIEQVEAVEARSDGRERWQVLGRANKPLSAGTLIDADAGLTVEVLSPLEGGVLDVAVSVASKESVEAVLERAGHVPIPPYLDRGDVPEDATRYQTVYAEQIGSVAAPTAGLHLTEALLARLEARGVRTARLHLSVGLGTFRPVNTDDLDQHPMHVERYSVPRSVAEAVSEVRRRGAPVVAVGTTVVRALESAADPSRPGEVNAVEDAETRLLIQPGYRFRVVDALLTNFHQPRSTLLALVSAFAGYDRTFAAYRHALSSGYRFLSYGDALWIPRRAD
jgi:S-adenosylmethionine:tRNA ribosyltransferase-isomerase